MTPRTQTARTQAARPKAKASTAIAPARPAPTSPRPARPTPASPRPAAPHLQVAYRLDALLHTMRALARSEEHLCSLLHSIQSQRTLPARARNELRQLLEDLPTDICDADRHAALDTLDPGEAPSNKAPASRTQSRAATAPSPRRPTAATSRPARKQPTPQPRRSTKAVGKAKSPAAANRRAPAEAPRSRKK